MCSPIEAIPPSLLFALICGHIGMYLFGMFSASMMFDRNKMVKQIKEYQDQREKELRQKLNNNWEHPRF